MEEYEDTDRINSLFAYDEVSGGIRLLCLRERLAEEVTVPGTIHGKPVVCIGADCFFRCRELREVHLPDGVLEIGMQAFAMCPMLRHLTLPDSLRRIGSFAFRDSPIQELTVPAGVETLEASVFSFCQSLKQVTLQEGLKTIKSHAFYSTDVGMETPLQLPASVETIEPGAFFTPIGRIQVQTCLPDDPKWYSDPMARTAHCK